MDELYDLQKEITLVIGLYGLIVLGILWYLQRTQREDAPRLTQNRSRILFWVFASVGILLRLVLAASLPGHSTDMNNFQAWASHSNSVGLENFYNGEIYTDCPPLYVYFLYAAGGIRNAFGLDSADGAMRILMRAPAIVSDVALAWIVYHLATKHLKSRTSALVLSSLILLNPAATLNSAVWGQIDTLQTLMLLGVLWLLGERRLVPASVLFMLAFLIKLQAVMIAPLLLFAGVNEIVTGKDKWKVAGRILLSLAAMAGTWILVALPFGLAWDPQWLWDKTMGSVDLYGPSVLNALNVYALFGLNWQPAADCSFLGLSLPVWGYIFAAFIYCWATFLYVKRRSTWNLFAIAGFVIIAAYSVLPGAHERYGYPAPFFLLFAYILCRDRRLLSSCVLSFVSVHLAQALSLYCYPDTIPEALLSACSVLSLACFVYTAWVVSSAALKGAQPQEFPKRITEKTASSAKQIKAQLQTVPGWGQCDRKDALIILLICAVYSLVAFTNLGTVDIPQTVSALEEETVIAFPETEQIAQFKYYAGYGQGKFAVQYSLDGVNYEPAPMTRSNFEGSEITHELGHLYKWQVYDLNIEARFVKLAPLEGELPLLEVGFFRPDGEQIVPSEVTTQDTVIREWTDEQGMVPYEPTYLTDFYFDEIYHVRTAYENIHGITPYEITHPPLGKIIIALGIELFGMNSIGWRIMGTIAGVCMLPVMYVLARMLFAERRFAVYATVLLAADGMHYAQTRIGTVDSYSILWIMVMYLFMYRYAMTNFNIQPLKETLKPLFWCGLFFGIGAATKWLCLYAGLGLLFLYIYLMLKRRREYLYAEKTGSYPELVRNYRSKLTKTLLWSVLFFILIPAAIYLVSYTPYTLVTDGGAYSFEDILGNQSYMLNYHANLNPDRVHPFSSKWFTWPFDVRPVLFFSNQTDDTVATLSTMGNPLIWWLGIVAAAALTTWAVRNRKDRSFTLLFLAAGALAEFLPWWFITREVFIYHYFAVVPFLILLIVYWLMELEKRCKWGRMFGYWIVGSCVGMFAALYPVITGVPVPREYIRVVRWFETWPFY